MDASDHRTLAVRLGRLFEAVLWDIAIGIGLRIAEASQLIRWTRGIAVRTGLTSARHSGGPIELRGVWPLLVRMPCLRRTLILDAMHWRRGLRSTVVIGVAKDGARLHAHAWLELPGMAANSTLVAKFRPIAYL